MGFEHRRVFLIGTGRCGSTVVHEVLARHPDTSFVTNLDDRVPGFHRVPGTWPAGLYRRLPTGVTQKSRLRFAPSEGYRLLDREVSSALSTPARDLVASDASPWIASRLSGLFDGIAERRGAPLFTHKFTGWSRAGFLAAVFPGARFVHVVRDGRAVANSWLQMPWWAGFQGPDHWQWGPLEPAEASEWAASDQSFAVLAALLWRRLIEAADRARADLEPSRWMEVRYEDIVSDPRQGFQQILDFCELEWSSAFEHGFRRHNFVSSRADAYLRDLGPMATNQIEQCIGEQLAVRGYR